MNFFLFIYQKFPSFSPNSSFRVGYRFLIFFLGFVPQVGGFLFLVVGLDWRQGKVVRGGMTGYCRGGFRMDALMSVKLISLLSPKGLREGNPGVLELEIDWV